MATPADRVALDSALRSAIAGVPSVVDVKATRVPALADNPEVKASQLLAQKLASEDARRPYLRATTPIRDAKMGSPAHNVFMGVKKLSNDGRAVWVVKHGDHELDVRFPLACQDSAVRLFTHGALHKLGGNCGGFVELVHSHHVLMRLPMRDASLPTNPKFDAMVSVVRDAI